MPLRPTLLQHAAIWSQLVPPIVGVAAGRAATPPRRWSIVWCLALAAQDAVAVAVARQVGNNMWVAYLLTPVTASVALWALSLWHGGARGRLALRAAIPLLLAVGAVLTLHAEDFRAFSLFVLPFYSLVLLLASVWTFLSRSLGESGVMLRQDWFWVVGALMLYFGTMTALAPVSFYFLDLGREDLIHYAHNAKAAMDVLAFAAITGGVLCPLRPKSSGGASSSRSLPSGSSSAPSGWQW